MQTIITRKKSLVSALREREKLIPLREMEKLRGEVLGFLSSKTYMLHTNESSIRTQHK
jgi:hypothetical protein